MGASRRLAFRHQEPEDGGTVGVGSTVNTGSRVPRARKVDRMPLVSGGQSALTRVSAEEIREVLMTRVYIVLSVAGFVLPVYPFLLFLLENGLDAHLFLKELFANHVSSFFAIDVIVSALVLVVFSVSESLRLGSRILLLPILGLLVGVSFAFPLLLYFRELHFERQGATGGG